MFCNNCGNKIDDDALFCPECGNKLVETEKKSPEVAQFENMIKTEEETDFIEQYNKKQESKKATAKLIFCIGAIIAIVAISVGIFVNIPFGKYIIASHYASHEYYGRAYNTIEKIDSIKAETLRKYYLLLYSVHELADERDNTYYNYSNSGVYDEGISSTSGSKYVDKNKINCDSASFDEIVELTEELLPSRVCPDDEQWFDSDNGKKYVVTSSWYSESVDSIENSEYVPRGGYNILADIKLIIYGINRSTDDIDNFIEYVKEASGVFDELEELKNGKRFKPYKELEIFQKYNTALENALSIYQKYSNNSFMGYYETKETIDSFINDMYEDINDGYSNSTRYYTSMSYKNTTYGETTLINDIKTEMAKDYFYNKFYNYY